jgi:acetyl esterase/lipase
MKFPKHPIVFPTKPYFARLKLHALLWFIKKFIWVLIALHNRKSRGLPSGQKPTMFKSYPPLPNYEARIFIPKSYKPGDKLLPLLIDMHGGGFCFGAPALDDNDNLILSNDHGICVVSIPYRLGPEYKYPTAIFDAAAMISAVIADETLPVDKSRVVIAGYSAGGALALSAPQLPILKGKIKGVVAYYPGTNNGQTREERRSRQKPSSPAGEGSRLFSLLPMFDVGWIPAGTDRRDPLLSVQFADRRDLPEKICIIGCEFDILCAEAEEMAEDLAKSEQGEVRLLTDGKFGWTKGGIRWEMIEGVGHSFNQSPGSGPEYEMWRSKTIEMHQGVVNWLEQEVYSVR